MNKLVELFDVKSNGDLAAGSSPVWGVHNFVRVGLFHTTFLRIKQASSFIACLHIGRCQLSTRESRILLFSGV